MSMPEPREWASSPCQAPAGYWDDGGPPTPPPRIPEVRAAAAWLVRAIETCVVLMLIWVLAIVPAAVVGAAYQWWTYPQAYEVEPFDESAVIFLACWLGTGILGSRGWLRRRERRRRVESPV